MDEGRRQPAGQKRLHWSPGQQVGIEGSRLETERSRRKGLVKFSAWEVLGLEKLQGKSLRRNKGLASVLAEAFVGLGSRATLILPSGLQIFGSTGCSNPSWKKEEVAPGREHSGNRGSSMVRI